MPTVTILGNQRVRIAGVGGPARTYDGGKRAKGSKRHLLGDAGALALLSNVHAADFHDPADAEVRVGAAPRSALSAVRLVWADSAYTGALAERAGAQRGWRLKVVRHHDT